MERGEIQLAGYSSQHAAKILQRRSLFSAGYPLSSIRYPLTADYDLCLLTAWCLVLS